MTAKRFTFHHDVDGIDYIEDESNGICLICDELMCKVLNGLHEDNEELRKAIDNCQFRTLDLLDYIKEKDVVTHQEIKDWWNREVIK